MYDFMPSNHNLSLSVMTTEYAPKHKCQY